MANTTSLKLTEDLKEKVATLSQGVAQTPHAYMVEAIAEKVARDERRREFLAAAEESAADVARSGLVYRSEDVHQEVVARVARKRPPKVRQVKLSSIKRKA